MNRDAKIFIAGHNGMVGSAIMRNMVQKGYTNLITAGKAVLNLTQQSEVEKYFDQNQPEYVIIAAAKVGGIQANNIYRGQFLYENMMIQNNIIHSAHLTGVKKLLFLGSSCIYPKNSPQPMKEEYLLTNTLEFTNEPYAIAKIAGIKMCESYYRQYGDNFISVMPTNLYGINDNFNLESSHVLPALIRKIDNAKIKNENKVRIWGTGKPTREFLYVDDMADACVHIIENLDAEKIYDEDGISHINVGCGKDISISNLASLIKDIIGYSGDFILDTSKPDGTYQKLLDVQRLRDLKWKQKISLEEGIRRTYAWFCDHKSEIK